MQSHCPFCHPNLDQIFFESHLVLGLWAVEPVTPGHALLVPRRHVTDWFGASVEEQRELMAGLGEIRDAMVARGHLPAGFRVEMNWGSQGDAHLQVHLLPRYAGDKRAEGRLVTGERDPLLRHLHKHLDMGVKADIAVAFLTVSGLEKVLPRLRELLERRGSVRFLTGDQELFNHPAALRRLLDLGSEGCQLRVFECDGRHHFHPKFYLFEGRGGELTAFVGSSNLTEQALRGGIEWNYRVAGPDESAAHLRQEFEKLFQHPNTRVLDEEWIAAYEARRPLSQTHLAGGASLAAEARPPGNEELPPAPDPHEIQLEAMQALEQTRAQGYRAGLVVLATGLGKTWLAAFDSQRFRRVLFVAHREEILAQARDTFRRIRPGDSFGLYTGQEKVPQAQILFASIQTLGRAEHLRQFAPEDFDYIVVDEFHHASAASYRRLLNYFRCRFLLALTATPERSDGGNLLALCEENLVYRCDFLEGIRRERLCPFHYFGVPDQVDYRNIPWRNKTFDPEQLEHALVSEARARNALEQYQQRAGQRTLAFCCSMRHADYMAEFFERHQVRAVAVHSGAHSAPRAASLEQLRDGQVDVVCCVDMFNEGVDLPSVDTILMLRPTESRILWLQQIGRGLRRAEGKSHVCIIDYIGNHKSFLNRPMSLLGATSSVDLLQRLEQVQSQQLVLPPGCSVTYELEAIDLIRELLPAKRANALESYYHEFSELQGVRPTACEAYHDGRNPRSARKAFGSWLGFVASQKDGLSIAHRQAYQEQRPFLESLETTQMTLCFKMLVLQAMLARRALPGSLPVEELAQEVTRLAQRTPRLAAEFGEHLKGLPGLIRHLERNPIEAWTGGKGTGGSSYFYYREGVFGSNFQSRQGEALRELVQEIVDWRLAEYLDRPKSSGLECKVIHAGGKPILTLDRKRYPDLPQGWTSIRCDDKVYEFNFVKVAVNVAYIPGTEKNALPQLLRGWFGPDAGLPGTAFRVRLELEGQEWRMQPIGVGPEKATLWKRYSREQIPPLFGLNFNPAIWNTGFVVQKPHIFLLTTLDKEGQQEAHQYQDHFLSPEIFEWQSQNRTTQASAAGQSLRSPDSLVHLFVRPDKRAPFFYCGTAEFVKWEGEQPINVTWRLRTPIPENMRLLLGVLR